VSPKVPRGPIVGLMVLLASSLLVLMLLFVLHPQTRASAPRALDGDVASPGSESSLRGVTCFAPNSCFSVGFYAPTTSYERFIGLIERWNGATWSIVPSPSPASDTELHAVACPTARFCVATGVTGLAGDSTSLKAFIEEWNGNSWRLVASPSPGIPSDLEAVSCATADRCWAVGYTAGAAGGLPNALVEEWDGRHWKRADMPLPPGTFTAQINGVSCPAPTACIAVGSYGDTLDDDDPDARTVAEAWNGSSWSMIKSPNPFTGNHDVMLAVTCSSPSSCISVGDFSTTGNFYHADEAALVALWTGSGWQEVANPAVRDGSQGQLDSVVCPSDDRCFGVGFTSTGDDANPAVLVEGGTLQSWSILPLTGAGHYLSIACESVVRCVAVGDVVTSHSPLGQAAAQWLDVG
jgi:hypothetical protein